MHAALPVDGAIPRGRGTGITLVDELNPIEEVGPVQKFH